MRIEWILDGEVPVRARQVSLAAMISALAQHNLEWLRTLTISNRPLSLYDTGVKYVHKPFDPWCDYRAILNQGETDCEDAVAARLSDYWIRDIPAMPLVEWHEATQDFHATVYRQDINHIEDPSKILRDRVGRNNWSLY